MIPEMTKGVEDKNAAAATPESIEGIAFPSALTL